MSSYISPFVIFALTWLTAVITPGPNFVLIASTSTSQSRQIALFVALGISLGTAVWGVVGFLGIALFISSSEWAYLAVKLFGGCYLIYIGSKLIIKSSFTKNNEDYKKTSNVKMPLMALWMGFLTNIANPKTAVFVASLFASSQVLMTEASAYMSVPIMMLLSLFWHSIVAITFSSKRMIYQYQQIKHLIDLAAGIILIGYGINFSIYSILENFLRLA